VANDPIHLSPTRILRVLIAVMAFLLLMNLALQYGVYSRGLDLHGPLTQFDVGRERNLPTAFSILLLLSCCFMLATIAAKNAPGAGCGFIALDDPDPGIRGHGLRRGVFDARTVHRAGAIAAGAGQPG
jgi:1,4-dihydroxy-2-naphthoate octaprenyltransferase